jgi:nucleotide-binding universal stress UspA family protein
VRVLVTSSTLLGRPISPTQAETLETEARRLLDEATAAVRSAGGEVASATIRQGEHLDRELVQAQEETGAGLLVIGATTGGTVARTLLSTPTGAVRRSRGSVLVVRGSDEAAT